MAAANAAVEEGRATLAKYFNDDFKRAKEKVLHFNLDAKVDEFDPFKIPVDRALEDEE